MATTSQSQEQDEDYPRYMVAGTLSMASQYVQSHYPRLSANLPDQPCTIAAVLHECAKAVEGATIPFAMPANPNRLPKPISQERLHAIQDKVLKETANQDQLPHVLLPVGSKSNLPTVTCSFILKALNWELGMAQENFHNVPALWDSGAGVVCVTDDVLSRGFKAHLQDDKHDASRVTASKGPRIQISCLVEFSNLTMVQFDTAALVIPAGSAPNGWSG
ncbi:unnamed protein product [Parascedosporium putredinis]|uniref:Uncharacterized protein n=1 Tax=Parascedosporium putredinis TaxID=1442378 RepID=A0A9P1MFV9_9PEZI|nr:unnamed protein product [Parascedosporium putredinis]CAI8004256.1 unnamed protein product [Parascedosporium putredinis]